jgi:4-hydroxy-3-polyprenylbenzoate decarboxylase
MKKLIIAITGASGAIYAVRLLEVLKKVKDIETHLIISKAANITIAEETNLKISDIQKLADYNYNVNDIAASISSGSFKTDGMIIAPCSMKTLAEVATGLSSNLISRAADVVLKERRRLVLMVRETPFHTVHINHMKTLSEMGAIIAPPVPAFYNNPKTIDDIVNHSVGRVLDLFDIDSKIVKRWKSDKK